MTVTYYDMRLIDQILSADNLQTAWREVAAKHSAPGVDDITVKRWKRNWEERLDELSMAVRTNTYHQQKMLHYSVYKKNGGVRQISILTVRDRVLQRAVLQVVEYFFDQTFMDCSYGYRPGRGVRDAIPAILAYREAGRRWVLDADIDECFASLKHALIARLFEQVVDDRVVLSLLEGWLEQGAVTPGTGISLGAVISPLLCNLVLDRLDHAMAKLNYHLVRYADDFCVFCGSEGQALGARKAAAEALETLELRLEPAKTRVTNFEEGFDFLGVHFYRDEYSFLCQQKKIEVKGDFDASLFYDYVPDGYE